MTEQTTWLTTRSPGILRDAKDDGRFRIAVDLGTAGGRRQRVVRVVHGTLADADALRTRLKAERDQGKRRPQGGDGTPRAFTVESWITYYLDLYRSAGKKKLQPSSRRLYDDLLRLYIAPAIGARPLARLQADDVQRLYNGLSRQRGDRPPLAPASQAVVSSLLRQALKKAAQTGRIPSDPSTGAEHPTRPGPRRRTLPTREQVRALLESMRASKSGAHFALQFALETGFRSGEVIALEWAALDLDSGTVTVQRNAQRVTGTHHEFTDHGKTKASDATLPLSPSTVAWLKAYRALLAETRLKLGPRWTDADGNLVFPCLTPRAGYPAGRAWSDGALRHQVGRHAEKLGFEMDVHDARRCYISAAAAAGVPLTTLRDMARHQKTATTADVYAYTGEGDLRGAALAVDGLWAHD